MPATTDATKAYLDLKSAVRLFPGRDGKPTHVSTFTRWILRGARLRNGERIRLRAIKLPGGWRTTPEWIDQFIGALTADRIGESTEEVVSSKVHLPRRTPAQRRADAEEAARQLAALGC